jgi:hypothetical protein
MSTKRPEAYKAFGFWHVTTEGDEEGRSTKDLGIHEGFLDEVAFALAPQAFYGLKFSAVDPHAYLKLTDRAVRNQVSVLLDIDSGTWDLTPTQRVDLMTKILEDRPVIVRSSRYFVSVELLQGRNPEERTQIQEKAQITAALAKLTEEERKLLGLV